jgi:hypothetical protein
MHCDGYPMAGAEAAFRLARWTITDPLTPGFVTLALQGDAGMGRPDGARARAGAAGLSVTSVGVRNGLRVLAFVTPQAVWGQLRLDDPTRFARQFGLVAAPTDTPFQADGVRLMVAGGLALVSTRTGVGLHVGLEQVVVHGSRARVGAGVSLRAGTR